jgi:XTP/dITP diphosphohydrolase
MRPFPVMMIASLNRGKQKEFKALFETHHINVALPEEYIRNPSILESAESHEKSATYLSNAKSKCALAFHAAKVPTFADDSGLEIEALQGKPGVLTSQTNSKKILEQLKGGNRKARCRSVLVFMVEGVHLVAEGVCEGTIADSPRGQSGFGFDNIFIPDAGGGKTFAEMTMAEKNAVSHRHRAVCDLIRQMEERNIQLVRP